MSARSGLTRFELLATVGVVVLAVLGVIALWPSGPSTGPARAGSPAVVTELDDAELGPARARAALAPCPGAVAPSAGPGAVASSPRPAAGQPGAGQPGTAPAAGQPRTAPVVGPLAGVRVPCLGAPGVVEPAAGLAGRDALLNVWASWCAPCRAEMPALAEYAARPDAVPVLGIDVRDRPGAALATLAELGVRLPTVVDADGALTAALRPPALPVSYLLRADGSVARVEPLVPFHSADEVAAAVARLRQGGS